MSRHTALRNQTIIPIFFLKLWSQTQPPTQSNRYIVASYLKGIKVHYKCVTNFYLLDIVAYLTSLFVQASFSTTCQEASRAFTHFQVPLLSLPVPCCHCPVFPIMLSLLFFAFMYHIFSSVHASYLIYCVCFQAHLSCMHQANTMTACTRTSKSIDHTIQCWLLQGIDNLGNLQGICRQCKELDSVIIVNNVKQLLGTCFSVCKNTCVLLASTLFQTECP